MPIQTPFVTPFVNIRDFGAMPNDPRSAVRLANSEAFRQAQAAMLSDPNAWGHPIFVPSGTYYLADDLHIKKSLEMFGTGVQGESILMFPAIFKITNDSLACLTAEGVPNNIVDKLKSLIDIEFLDKEELMRPVGQLIGDNAAAGYQAQTLKCSAFRGTSLIIDPNTNMHPESGGSDSMIRDLQIVSEEDWTTKQGALFVPDNFDPPAFDGKSKGTPGIKMHSTAIIQRVTIEHFTGTGIYIFAGDGSNADYWRIHDVFVSTCGGHGIHVDGGETQGGLCTGTKMVALGGCGVVDNSGGGNTYVGCYVYESPARGYISDTAGQNTFVGCNSEAAETVSLTVGGHVWLGGNPGGPTGGSGFTDDTLAFIATDWGTIHPFEVPNLKDPAIRLLVGYPVPGNDPTTLYAWANNNGDHDLIRWDMEHKIWSTEGEDGSEVDDEGKFIKVKDLASRHLANYLTGKGHPRGALLQGFDAMLLGPANSPMKISYGEPPGDGEPGDIVYNVKPGVGEYVGRICTGPGQWKSFGEIVDE